MAVDPGTPRAVGLLDPDPKGVAASRMMMAARVEWQFQQRSLVRFPPVLPHQQKRKLTRVLRAWTAKGTALCLVQARRGP